MNGIHEAWQAVAELLGDFARRELSPCTTLALGNLAMVSGHRGDPSLAPARRQAAERRNSALERALRVAAGV
jgi:hypothetical protein